MAKIISGGRISQSNQESLGGSALRNVVSGGIKAAGAPGNIASTLLSLLNLPAPAESRFSKGIQEIQSVLPTSENLTSLAQNILPEGYTEPKSQLGGAFQSGLQTLGELLTPIPGLGSLGLKAAAPLAATSAAGGLVAPSLGFSKEAGELAGLVGPSLAKGIKGLPKALQTGAGEIYQAMEKTAEKIKPIKSKGIFSELAKIEKNAARKLTDEVREPINEAIKYVGEAINPSMRDIVNAEFKGIKPSIRDLEGLSKPDISEASVESLVGAYQKINDLLNSGIPKKAQPSILQIKNEIIPNLLKSENPGFASLFERANKTYSSAHGQTVLEKMLPKVLLNPKSGVALTSISPLTYGTLALFGYPVAATTAAKIGIGGITLPAANEVLRRIEPLIKSQELRTIATELGKAGLKDNARSFSNAIFKMDKLFKDKKITEESHPENQGRVLSGGRL